MKSTVGRSAAQPSDKRKLRTSFSHIRAGRFVGYVVDPVDLDRRFTVEITVNGYVAHVIRADVYVHELTEQSLGDGFYGFSVSLDFAPSTAVRSWRRGWQISVLPSVKRLCSENYRRLLIESEDRAPCAGSGIYATPAG